jgi:hypothetical protein
MIFTRADEVFIEPCDFVADLGYKDESEEIIDIFIGLGKIERWVIALNKFKV